MRIVDRKTFLSLPPGTIFAKYTPCIFEEWRVKDETSGNDFYCRELVSTGTAAATDSALYFDELKRAESEEVGPLDFETICRDGCFDDDQLFAVLSPEDVKALAASIRALVEHET